jgi:GT2 family glycosyltransferase
MNPMLSIVIPVHNRKRFTYECLCSLEKQTLRADFILVVDDGSTDGTAEMLEEDFPDVIVLKGNGNLFWTAAVNRGVRYALDIGSDYILTLNNDTLAPPDFLEKMMAWARKKPNVLLGALDVDAHTKKKRYGGEIINWAWSSSLNLLNKLRPEEQKGIHEVSLFPGRGLLIPKNVFNKIGLFEEKKLPHYMADYDFTLRAARNNFPVYCNYDAQLYTYPAEAGNYEIRKSKTFSNYLKHLFNIKGGGNLKNFTIYTLRNCPSNYIPISLLTGYVRRLSGYWLK